MRPVRALRRCVALRSGRRRDRRCSGRSSRRSPPVRSADAPISPTCHRRRWFGSATSSFAGATGRQVQTWSSIGGRSGGLAASYRLAGLARHFRPDTRSSRRGRVSELVAAPALMESAEGPAAPGEVTDAVAHGLVYVSVVEGRPSPTSTTERRIEARLRRAPGRLDGLGTSFFKAARWTRRSIRISHSQRPGSSSSSTAPII